MFIRQHIQSKAMISPYEYRFSHFCSPTCNLCLAICFFVSLTTAFLLASFLTSSSLRVAKSWMWHGAEQNAKQVFVKLIRTQ